ncbi:hypothetical protein DFH27DRAFT_532924 [Peziza echinospora]|nr:hypothetical protein DFH27DRAFT_532924 [Peziza echinospora]
MLSNVFAGAMSFYLKYILLCYIVVYYWLLPSCPPHVVYSCQCRRLNRSMRLGSLRRRSFPFSLFIALLKLRWWGVLFLFDQFPFL